MTIHIRCGSCEKGFKAPEAAAGKRVKCPSCAAAIEVPAVETGADGVGAPPSRLPAGETPSAQVEVSLSRLPPAATPAADDEASAGDSPYRIGKAAAIQKKRTRCWNCSIEVSPRDVDCPECGAGLRKVKRRKPAGAKKRKKKQQEPEKDDRRESLFGAFAYAFPAVLRGKGWLCCLWCAAVMAVVPILPAIVGLLLMCIPFAGPIIYLCMMFIIVGAAPAGILSRNMEISSRWGVREEMKHWEMSLTDEMIPSSIEILKANVVLGILPLVIAGVFAAAFGGFVSTTFGSVEVVGQVGSIMTGLLYVGAALACSFCGPMCIMLLGATDVANAIYPPNVFKVLSRTFPQYLAFYFYIVLLAVATYIVAATLGVVVALVFGSIAVLRSEDMFTMVLGVLSIAAAWAIVSVLATYFSAVVGWSMGIFIHRNYEHFEAVRE